MMRNWNANQWLPYYHNMMWPTNAKVGSWFWFFQIYHVVLSVLVLFILILVAAYLWKKIELMDKERKK